MIPLPKIISFYTNDWIYPDHAERLRRELRALKLDFRIDLLDSTGSYGKNCCLKPHFIRDCLKQEQQPLLWMDVDSSIYQKPELLTRIDGYDLASVKRSNSTDLQWHVGTLWFAPTENSFRFLDRWCDIKTSTDDRSFNMTVQEMSDRIKMFTLPSTYLIHLDKPEINTPPVIAYRLSTWDRKLKEKNLRSGNS